MPDMGRQFQQRLKAWRQELNNQLYTEVGEVSFEGFTTTGALTQAVAERGPFSPCPAGTGWGAAWEYGWFRADVALPEACEGHRAVLLPGVGGEQLVYVNGRAAGAVDREHTYVTLTRAARSGETFHVLIESYAGHGPRLESLPPCPPERRAVPDAPAAQCVVAPSRVAVWNEDAYQLLLDVETLTSLLGVLPETSLRSLRVAEALDEMTRVVDLELPWEERCASFRAGRAVLAPALACRNGSTAPEMRIIGQSHIDLAWLWPREETFHKACRTYATQLQLMEEYPEYRWLLVEPALEEMLKARDPELWRRVLDAHARGQVRPEGAFWIECDTNIPSGESLIRQLIWGRRWFRETFGEESVVAWLPDCFGFSAALPQLFRKLGVRYFATQKLLRADPECQAFPYQNFIWEGVDGTEIEALSFMRDNGPISPFTFYQRWDLERTQKTGIDTMLHPFGYGDGGGGPTRDMVETALRLRDLEGVARSRWSGLREYFDEVTATPSKNRWVGELYLPWHRGTWTSQRRAKALIRRAEEAVRAAELASAMLPERDAAFGERIHAAWEKLLFCQFHDVAGGVGIARVHAEAAEALTAVVRDMRALADEARERLSGPAEGTVAVNTLTWPRREWLRLPDGGWRYAEVPAAGWAPLGGTAAPSGAFARQTPDGVVMENGLIRLTVAPDGSVTELVDLGTGRGLLKAGQRMNDWRLYRNAQAVYDAWELDRDWETRRVENAFTARVSVAMDTPGVCEALIERGFGQSRAVQRVRLYAGSRRVDFETHVDWHERHRMLKAHFESDILAEEALHEIQFGHVARPAHRSHAFAADRYEVCNQRWSALCEADRGFALLNDGIFGLSAGRGELALTLLRAPLVPDEHNNIGAHSFTYSLLPLRGAFAAEEVTREACALNEPLTVRPGAGRFEGPAIAEGTLVLDTVKRADDGRGLILRVWQSARSAGRGTLTLPFPARVLESAMDERSDGPLLGEGRSVEVTAGSFEVRTLRAIPIDRTEEDR